MWFYGEIAVGRLDIIIPADSPDFFRHFLLIAEVEQMFDNGIGIYDIKLPGLIGRKVAGIAFYAAKIGMSDLDLIEIQQCNVHVAVIGEMHAFPITFSAANIKYGNRTNFFMNSFKQIQKNNKSFFSEPLINAFF